MSDEATVTHWIREIKTEAEGEAQQRIWERYFDRLVALAQTKLRGLQAYEGAEDAALSAMKSLLVRASHGRFPQLEDRTELWPLLVKITVRKVADVYRRQMAECRDVRRSVSLEAIVGEEPTPELAGRLFDQVDCVLDSLKDDSLAEVARLKLEGYKNLEIAEIVGKSLTTVERKLALIREKLSGDCEG